MQIKGFSTDSNQLINSCCGRISEKQIDDGCIVLHLNKRKWVNSGFMREKDVDKINHMVKNHIQMEKQFNLWRTFTCKICKSKYFTCQRSIKGHNYSYCGKKFAKFSIYLSILSISSTFFQILNLHFKKRQNYYCKFWK